MYFSDYLIPYAFSIAVLLWIIPIIWLCIKRKVFRQFTIQKLTQAVNRSLIYYGIFALALMIVMKVIDTCVYGQGDIPTNADVYEIVIDTSYLYVVYAFFLYVLIIVLLNLATFIAKKLNKNN